MKQFIFFIFGLLVFNVQSQTFTLIEKNKHTTALFNYEDPLSLMGLIYNNVDRFVSSYEQEGQAIQIKAFSSEGIKRLNLNKSEFISVETRPNPIEIYTGFGGDNISLQKSDESFEDWYLNLSQFLEDDTFLPNKQFIQSVWEKTKIGDYLSETKLYYFDVRNIDLLILEATEEDTIIHFAKKMADYSKRIIVASISKYNLMNIFGYSVPKMVDKTFTNQILEELKTKQLQKYENCLKEYFEDNNSIFDIAQHNVGLVSISPYINANYWERTLQIAKDLTIEQKLEYFNLGKVWSCKQEVPDDLLLYTNYGELVQITKDNSPSFRTYFNKLQYEGEFTLSEEAISKLEKKWQETQVGSTLTQDLKTNYLWWDFDNPELLIDYQFQEFQDNNVLKLIPTGIFIVKDLPTINKKINAMYFDLTDELQEL